MTDFSEILPKTVGTMNLSEVMEKNTERSTYFPIKRCCSEDDQVGSWKTVKLNKA
jgi:hypothetical protein